MTAQKRPVTGLKFAFRIQVRTTVLIEIARITYVTDRFMRENTWFSCLARHAKVGEGERTEFVLLGEVRTFRGGPCEGDVAAAFAQFNRLATFHVSSLKSRLCF